MEREVRKRGFRAGHRHYSKPRERPQAYRTPSPGSKPGTARITRDQRIVMPPCRGADLDGGARRANRPRAVWCPSSLVTVTPLSDGKPDSPSSCSRSSVTRAVSGNAMSTGCVTGDDADGTSAVDRERDAASLRLDRDEGCHVAWPRTCRQPSVAADPRRGLVRPPPVAVSRAGPGPSRPQRSQVVPVASDPPRPATCSTRTSVRLGKGGPTLRPS